MLLQAKQLETLSSRATQKLLEKTAVSVPEMTTESVDASSPTKMWLRIPNKIMDVTGQQQADRETDAAPAGPVARACLKDETKEVFGVVVRLFIDTQRIR